MYEFNKNKNLKKQYRVSFAGAARVFGIDYILLTILFILMIISAAGTFVSMIILMAYFKTAVYLLMIFGIAAEVGVIIFVKWLANVHLEARTDLLNAGTKINNYLVDFNTRVESLEKEVTALKENKEVKE